MTKNRSLPTLTLPEQGRESSNTPSPDWGRSGWGVSRKGFTFNASLRPSSRSPLQVQKVLKLFSPLQSVQQCDSGSQPGMTKNQSLPTLTLPEQGRESSNTPSPDWGRSGWGVSRKGFTFNASLRPSSRSPLQVQKVLKLFSPSQSVQLCDSESSSG